MSFRTELAFVMVVIGALPLAGAQAAATQAKSAAPQVRPVAKSGKEAPPAAGAKAGGEPATSSADAPATSKAPQKAQGSSAAAATVADTDQLVEPAGFAYSPEARRDPFVSLLRRGSTARSSMPTLRPPGLGGLSVDEITLRGTLRNRESFVGIAQGADQRTYIVRAGDKLLDGTIRAISQNDMVIVQQINDPLSLETQREVRKVLRQIEAK